MSCSLTWGYDMINVCNQITYITIPAAARVAQRDIITLTFLLPHLILKLSGCKRYDVSGPSNNPLLIPDSMTWVYANRTYNETYFKNNGSCQNTQASFLTIALYFNAKFKQDYKWGFSFIQLFLMVVFLLAWTTGIWILRLRVDYSIRQRQYMHITGEFKAVLELGDALNDGFKKLGENPNTLDESQICFCINKNLEGGSISYQAPLEGNNNYGWFEREMWWLFVSVQMIVMFGTAWQYSFVFWVFSLGPACGCIMATSVGSTIKSRMLIVFFSCILGSLVAAVLMGTVPNYMRY